MAEQGQPTTRAEKKLLVNWAAAFAGVAVGAIGGAVALGAALHNPALGSMIGAVAGGVAGFGAPHLWRATKAH
jgi:hypothetical protein